MLRAGVNFEVVGCSSLSEKVCALVGISDGFRTPLCCFNFRLLCNPFKIYFQKDDCPKILKSHDK